MTCCATIEPMLLEIDHVVICVNDLDEASALFESRFGLVSYPGGEHVGHGTANHIVPLGSSYLELAAVVDGSVASASAFGRWVLERAALGPTPDSVCLRTDDLGLLSTTLGLEVETMSRTRPDGVLLAWRLAGLDGAIEEGLPFFIQWDIPGEHHPGRAALRQAVDETSIEVSLRGDVEQLSPWLGSVNGLTMTQGPPAVDRVTIREEGRVIQI